MGHCYVHFAFVFTRSPGDFFVFYIKNVNKTKNICLNKKILRTFVDTHAACTHSK